ncbi:MAG: CHASE3 domain-containing protein [Flavobacteriales bacterium]|mgnify:CR=1 FL=1|jgi:signal transduction histidine kinase|nr:CHASE3 domain-containing protein [Flavobacteriales bacterium]MBK6894622.1 CHASE3 domain-containing protein [Flavobacteriales bacterium]MBK7247202.1 CHASE3 domain-containing protein [Flavobacteriales bacterium]MBK9599563.1 CHASE3 domain-containing protein [Flavobacteriales bacterium]QQS71649.1 MAG: CHASE3 domain-containing protein [Flavobacteriales bacterium]
MFRIGDPAKRNLKERRLLRGLYAGTVILLAIFLFATIRTFDRYSSANRSIREGNAVLQELELMVSGLKDAQAGYRGYVLTHDTSFVLPFRIAQPAVEQSIRRLDSLSRAGATSLDLSKIQELSRQMLKGVQEQFLSERTSPIGLQGTELAQMQRSRDLMERVRTEQRQLTAEVERSRDVNLSEERSLKPDTPIMLVVYSILAILATGILFWRLFRALAKAERGETEIQRKVDELNKEVRTREFAERSLKRVLDSSPSSIMAFRSIRDDLGSVVDFEWILANRESVRIYGGREGGLIGNRLLTVMPELLGGDLFNVLLEVVESGMSYESDQQSTQRPDVWIHVHALRLLDGFVVTITDISETRRAQGLLAEGDRLAITGGIARTIAHEVRNPLTNLHMALEQMLDELEPEVQEEIKPYSEILQRNMHRISKLITDLLESSKAKELHKTPCNVEALLNTALASVQDRMDLLEMRADVSVESGVGEVMADPEVIGVALTNLCINAIEAMEEGKGHLFLKAAMHRDKVRVYVTDNGKGIAEENIQRLFQAFYSGRTGGMGLGLTSARTILNAHGVHMDVESTLGEGTTFTLTFPE